MVQCKAQHRSIRVYKTQPLYIIIQICHQALGGLGWLVLALQLAAMDHNIGYGQWFGAKAQPHRYSIRSHSILIVHEKRWYAIRGCHYHVIYTRIPTPTDAPIHSANYVLIGQTWLYIAGMLLTKDLYCSIDCPVLYMHFLRKTYIVCQYICLCCDRVQLVPIEHSAQINIMLIQVPWTNMEIPTPEKLQQCCRSK